MFFWRGGFAAGSDIVSRLGRWAEMRYPEGFINEIKSRVRLSDVIGRKVQLKKRGKDYVGLSPFSNEKTPSFYVHDDRGFYKCFSTQNSGDVFTYLMETERLTFAEAVEKMAAYAGLELPTASPNEEARYRRRSNLQHWVELAAEYFEAQLLSPAGEEARQYLQGRGFGPASWKTHRMGFAPDGWRNLLDHLSSKGAKTDELIEAGLLVQPDGAGKSPYDRFRNRVTFTICDPSGKAIAFGARTLDPDGKPKYLNSSDSPLFHKGRTLYRLGPAREALSQMPDGALSRGLVVTEGYVDAIALAEAGVGTGVAPLGTALTEEQLDYLWRAGPEPILCFDGDRAGVGAAYRALDRGLPMLEPGKSLYFTILPDGMDPDDVIRRHGRDTMVALLEGARPLVEMLWKREVEAEALDTPERRAGLEDRLMKAVEAIKHPGVKKAYERELRDRLYWLARGERRGRQGGPDRTGYGAGGGSRGRLQAGVQPRGFVNLIKAINSPAILERAREAVCAAEFNDPDVTAIRDAAFSVLDNGERLDRAAVAAHLRSLGRNNAVSLLETTIPAGRPVEPDSAEGIVLLRALQRFPAANVMADEARITREGGEVDAMTDVDEARLRAMVLGRRKVNRWSSDELAVAESEGGSGRLKEALGGLESEMKRRSGT